jgi:hypothetical protein
MNQLAPLPSPALLAPVLVAAAGDKASTRSLEVFAANIRNWYTRRAGATERKAFGRANGKTLEAKILFAYERNEERFVWLP